MEIPTEVQTFITQLLVVSISTLLPILVAYVIGYIRAKKNEFLARLSQEQVMLLESVVNIAVRAAEQSGLAGYIENTAQQKLEYAEAYVQTYLKNAGWGGIDVALIRGAIEAAIKSGWEQGGGLYGVTETTLGVNKESLFEARAELLCEHCGKPVASLDEGHLDT